jgi:precorrin-2 dehydrogenase/sirohydrochlorin ferrochelatase
MLDLDGRLAVIVGTGPAAVRMAISLKKHGADVVVITPDVTRDLQNMQWNGEITVEPRGYVRGDLEGAFLVVAASDSEETDAAVAEEARERGTLINMRRDGAASSFIVPSVVRRGDLQIAVSTAGKAPSVARQVKRAIAVRYGEEWGPYTQLVADLRTLAVERTGLSDQELAPLFSFVVDSGALERIRSGENVTAKDVYRWYRTSLEALKDQDRGEGTGE